MLFTYTPQLTPLPETERRPLDLTAIKDSTGFNTVNLDVLAGRYVYLDLWATWCLPCRQEMPFLQQLREQYPEDKLAILSLSVDREEDLQRWVADRRAMHMRWTNWILFDGLQSSLAHDYQIKGIPTYFILDPQGRVMFSDAPRPSDRRLHGVLRQLLD